MTLRLGKPSLLVLISLLSIFYVLAPVSPRNLPRPYTDSGVFLYTGWRILKGEVPYRDVWDHKPPGIYYIDAAGLAIGGGSRWGVWLLEAASLSAAVVLGFALLDAAFGTLPAVLATSLWLGSLPFVLEGGNLTTEYAIPMQFGILYLAFIAEKRGWLWWQGCLIGALTAVTFLLKQTTVGATLAVVLFLVATRSQRKTFASLARELSSIGIGAFAILALVAVCFAQAGALGDLWDAVFRYNRLYTQYASSFTRVLKASITGLDHLSPVGLSALGLGGWITATACLLSRGSTPQGFPRHLLTIAVLDLPIELGLTGLSGRGYGHYYMTLLPVLALLAGHFCAILLVGLEGLLAISGQPSRKAVLSLVVVGFALASQFPAIYQYRSISVKYREANDPGVIEYIEAHTSVKDYVLVLGSQAVFNFEARRASPTRFVYQDPLGLPGYTSVELVEGFLAEVVEHRPVLILALAGKGIAIEEFEFDSYGIGEAIEFIETRYRPVDQVGSWMVYRYDGSL